MSDMDGIREILRMMADLPGVDKNERSYKCIRLAMESTKIEEFRDYCMQCADPFSSFTDEEIDVMGEYAELLVSGIETFLAAHPEYKDEKKWNKN